MARLSAGNSRRIVSIILVVILVISAVVGITVYVMGRVAGATTTPATPTTSPASPAAPPAMPPAGSATSADGCLGGPDVTGQMVLDAQAAAPLTSEGAAAFSASFMRWVGAQGWPSLTEAQAVLPATVSEAGNPNASQLLAQYEGRENPDQRVGGVLTTIDGRYYVEAEAGTQTVVSVALNALDSSGQAAQSEGTTVTLDSSSGVWMITGIAPSRSNQDIASIGQAFAGGC